MLKTETPFLINTNISSFEEYIDSLSKTSKKNFKYVQKHNNDLSYSIIPYDKSIVMFFMNLWEMQLIRGKMRKWGFGIDYIDQLNIRNILNLFAAYTDDGTVISLHFTERYDDYVYCHPPMYNKDTFNDRYIAKYMWFNLINFYINSNVCWVDLGAGDRGTWKDLVINRELYMEKMAYKWTYVPEKIKNNPEMESNYIVKVDNFNRKLVIC